MIYFFNRLGVDFFSFLSTTFTEIDIKVKRMLTRYSIFSFTCFKDVRSVWWPLSDRCSKGGGRGKNKNKIKKGQGYEGGDGTLTTRSTNVERIHHLNKSSFCYRYATPLLPSQHHDLIQMRWNKFNKKSIEPKKAKKKMKNNKIQELKQFAI